MADAAGFFAALPPSVGVDVSAVAHVILRSDDGDQETWTVVIDSGRVRADRGETSPPSFTLTMHRLDFDDLIEGAATLKACLIDGRVEIEGDLSHATRLAPLLLARRA